MSAADKYTDYFTHEYMMGPNTIRLLDEIVLKYPLPKGARMMDLGCGTGLSSLYLARETQSTVYAVDLWCSATDNYRRFTQWNIQNSAIPLHADALALPFADGYFDAIVSVDSYHYFACDPDYFGRKLLPLVKPGGTILIVVPGLHKEFGKNVPTEILEWAGEEYTLFHSCEWWKNTLGEHPSVASMTLVELQCGDKAWQEWFASGHKYATRDQEFFHKGIGKYLTFVGMAIRTVNA